MDLGKGIKGVLYSHMLAARTKQSVGFQACLISRSICDQGGVCPGEATGFKYFSDSIIHKL